MLFPVKCIHYSPLVLRIVSHMRLRLNISNLYELINTTPPRWADYISAEAVECTIHNNGEKRKFYWIRKWKFIFRTSWNRWNVGLQSHKDNFLLPNSICQHFRQQHGRAYYHQHQKDAYSFKLPDPQLSNLRSDHTGDQYSFWLHCGRKQLCVALWQSHVQAVMACADILHLCLVFDACRYLIGSLPANHAPI